MTWQGYEPTHGNVDVECVDWTVEWQMWENGSWTHGILVELGGATWPMHGPPHGALWFDKIFWSLWGSNAEPPTGSTRWKSMGYH
jgi:hypothetical protein